MLLRRAWAPLLFVLWLVGLGAGLDALWAYSYTPGPAARAPERWPAQSAVRPGTARPTLIMFLHPLCTCSQASIHELGVLLSRVPAGVAGLAVRAVVAGAPDASADASALATQAAALPGVEVVVDERGTVAAAFGALVSGQVLVYSEDGALVFSGGMTQARGHQGDNDGLEAAMAVASGRLPRARTTPVFGCLLREDQSANQPSGATT
jgi:hypothetical protein